jgi:SPP1 gp7 family putative phage head morphogenesis protein
MARASKAEAAMALEATKWDRPSAIVELMKATGCLRPKAEEVVDRVLKEAQDQNDAARASHSAKIKEFRDAEALGIKLLAEWSTAGDDYVCDECAALQGKIFKLDEIEGRIPLHINCRCVALPVDVTDQEIAGAVPTSGSDRGGEANEPGNK